MTRYIKREDGSLELVEPATAMPEGPSAPRDAQGRRLDRPGQEPTKDQTPPPAPVSGEGEPPAAPASQNPVKSGRRRAAKNTGATQ